MADIISIATALPEHRHQQADIFQFMKGVYRLQEEESRKLKFLYDHSGIDTRYSVIGDYGSTKTRTFIPNDTSEAFPSLEERMKVYEATALPLSVSAVKQCIEGKIAAEEITHLITVSCTGMSAPGLDLQLLNALQLRPDIFRTSVNFMGCYAAIHALKLAKMICDSTPNANVVVVATELCTLHFQQEYTADNAASSLLFADGAAAVLLSNLVSHPHALSLEGFYSCVAQKGKADMAWELSSKGFLMTLTAYIPQLIGEDIVGLTEAAAKHHDIRWEDITHWCIHPGGKRILDVIQKKLQLTDNDLVYSRDILKRYGNMSSPSVLFVLKEMMDNKDNTQMNIMGMAFGPGLTMETFIAKR